MASRYRRTSRCIDRYPLPSLRSATESAPRSASGIPDHHHEASEVGIIDNQRCAMMKSVAGTYQNGKVELLEPAPEGAEGNVIVTFLANSHSVDLGKRGIS